VVQNTVVFANGSFQTSEMCLEELLPKWKSAREKLGRSGTFAVEKKLKITFRFPWISSERSKIYSTF
jgi:hypothetical protein